MEMSLGASYMDSCPTHVDNIEYYSQLMAVPNPKYYSEGLWVYTVKGDEQSSAYNYE